MFQNFASFVLLNSNCEIPDVQVKNAEADGSGDIPEVGFNDLKRILAKNGLPASPSGDSLNQLGATLSGYLLKASGGVVKIVSQNFISRTNRFYVCANLAYKNVCTDFYRFS